MKLFKVTTDDRSNKWVNLELVSEANLSWLPGGKPVLKLIFSTGHKATVLEETEITDILDMIGVTV
jgi:hypothetical protein